jgi:membrane-bound serine protease (ClpP class)
MKRVLWVGVCALLLTGAGGAAVESDVALIYTITLDDAIHPITARFLIGAIDEANDNDARLLIIRLDTPGGLMSSMEEMIEAITGSRVPVVVYVYGSKAASAGFFLTIAADVAVMAPGTRFGAAHPVAIMGDMPEDSPMMDKVENDAAAYARTLAENRGRNPEAAEEAVRKSSSYTEKEALELGLIDHIANGEGEILSLLDGTEIRRFDGSTETLQLSPARMVSLDMTSSERFLSVLASPALAALLFFVGILGLYIEFTHPGLIAPGLIGGICLLLFALSTQVLPVNWVGIALVVLGLVMFVLELQIPSYGFLTLGGIGCLILGSMLLFRSAPEMPGMAAARWIILSIAASAAVLMGILTTMVARVWRRRVTTGLAGIIAEEGTALTDLDPYGRVFVHGEYWNARGAQAIRKGARVRVTGARNLQLEVKEIP